MKSLFFIAIAVTAITGCQSFNHEKYSEALSSTVFSAEQYIVQEMYPQAAILSRAILDAEPDHSKAQKIKEQAIHKEPRLKVLFDKSYLGSNYKDRIRSENGFGWAIATYIPNRVLDILDILKLHVGFGIGVGVNITMTEYGALGAQVSAGETTIGLDRRHPGARAGIRDGAEIFAVEVGATAEVYTSTGGTRAIAHANAGLKSPTDDIYQTSRDFWEVGAQVQLAPITVDVGFHPVEMLDFIGGIFFLDFLNDDLGTSESIYLPRDVESELNELAKQTALK
ncbi:hypothetical protein [Candidatus Uabimicrobium sp. HlEnr_7]|uniref:hypothetical protein n=1 Tax=Candidatus Uabimicrobium helgolandensis TaxID=3095367 RepID=UPI00355665AD